MILCNRMVRDLDQGLTVTKCTLVPYWFITWQNILKQFYPQWCFFEAYTQVRYSPYSNELVTCRKCISKWKDVQQCYICNKAVFDVLECNNQLDLNWNFLAHPTSPMPISMRSCTAKLHGLKSSKTLSTTCQIGEFVHTSRLKRFQTQLKQQMSKNYKLSSLQLSLQAN